MTKTVKTENVKAQEIQKAIISSLQYRIDNVHLTADNEKGEENQRKNLKTEINFITLPLIEHAMKYEIDFNKLANQLQCTNKSSDDYVAIYAIQKIRKLLQAVAQNLTSSADGYTHTMLFNLMHGKQNNKTAYASLSRAIEFTESDTQEIIKKRYNCSANTASTQASSTRQTFRFLNIASVTKNKVNDVYSLNDNVFTKKLRELFIKDVELKTDKK